MLSSREWLAIVSVATACVVSPGSSLASAAIQTAGLPLRPACIPRNQCCRICKNGPACGNWCTKAIFNCEKVRGCACDATKVCP